MDVVEGIKRYSVFSSVEYKGDQKMEMLLSLPVEKIDLFRCYPEFTSKYFPYYSSIEKIVSLTEEDIILFLQSPRGISVFSRIEQLRECRGILSGKDLEKYAYFCHNMRLESTEKLKEKLDIVSLRSAKNLARIKIICDIACIDEEFDDLVGAISEFDIAKLDICGELN